MTRSAPPTDSSGPTDGSAEDLAHADIGLVCALPIELGGFLKRCERVRDYTGGDFTFRGGRYDGVKIAIVESGMGFERARRATAALIEAHTPNWVIATGFCGGLVPETRIGGIVAANEVVSQHGQRIDLDLHMEPNPAGGLHVGRMLTADRLVRLVETKKELAAAHSAIAVEMEALAVAQVCRDHGKPCLAIKAISDDLSADLPAEIQTIVGKSGTVRVGAAIGAVMKRFGSVKDMWKLRENAWKASDNLASFLDGVIVQLQRAGTKTD